LVKTNPIQTQYKANTNPIKANQSQFQTQNKANTNPQQTQLVAA